MNKNPLCNGQDTLNYQNFAYSMYAVKLLLPIIVVMARLCDISNRKWFNIQTIQKQDWLWQSRQIRVPEAKNESAKINPPPRSGVSLLYIRQGTPTIPLPLPFQHNGKKPFRPSSFDAMDQLDVVPRLDILCSCF